MLNTKVSILNKIGNSVKNLPF